MIRLEGMIEGVRRLEGGSVIIKVLGAVARGAFEGLWCDRYDVMGEKVDEEWRYEGVREGRLSNRVIANHKAYMANVIMR